jgi:pimeloyl-ACP methyl ester carboxylesterase
MKLLLKIVSVFLTLILVTVLGFIIASNNVRNEINQTLTSQLSEFGKTRQVNGVEVYYRESGNSNNPNLFFIHGFLGSSYDWIEMIRFYDDNYHVIAIDLPGFGASEKSLNYNYSRENQADTVIELIKSLQLEDVTLVGHSMGGMISLMSAYKEPELIKQLVLIGSAGVGSGGTQGTLPLFVYDYVVNNYYIQRTLFNTAYSPSEVEAGLVTDQMFKEMYYYTSKIPAEVFAKFSLDADGGYLDDKFESILQPTFLLWGSDDGFVSVENGYIMDQKLPNSTLAVIDQAGHLPFDTVLSEVIALINDFLNN